MFYFVAVNKQNSQILGPSVVRINCYFNSYSEDGPAWGGANYQSSFKPIPQGSGLAVTKNRICGTRWPYDNQTYYYLATNSANPPLDFWLRGNEVKYRGDKAEVLLAYNNPATGRATPVQAVVDCAKRTISEFDLLAGRYLGNEVSVQPMTGSIGAVVYDRACNTSRHYITRLQDKPVNTGVTSNITKRKEAEQRCESLGIARGTQPFSVCVKQLSAN